MSNYTKPKLRESIKDRVMASSKGGKPGQWSARKAQLLSQEYEKKGGGYSGGKSGAQKSFSLKSHINGSKILPRASSLVVSPRK